MVRRDPAKGWHQRIKRGKQIQRPQESKQTYKGRKREQGLKGLISFNTSERLKGETSKLNGGKEGKRPLVRQKRIVGGIHRTAKPLQQQGLGGEGQR